MRHVSWTLVLAAAVLSSHAATASTPPTTADFARYAEAILEDAYRTDAPGVAVLVMRGDDVLYRGARGQADVAAGVPLDPSDRFRIGSVTKQFAAAGLLTLVDAGKVALEDPLSKYLPDYPGGARITVEQLLNHTSGIRSFIPMPNPRRDVSTAQLVHNFKQASPEFAPGEGWAYNNSAYVLVGTVIEVASGQSWHRYLEQALFKPLGMADTGYGADPAVVADQVKGYAAFGNEPALAQPLSMTQPHAAGALVSTVDDLARWNRALHEGRVLTSATYTRMVTPVGKAKEIGYGYGIWTSTVRGYPSLQHSGGIPGFDSHLTYVPGPDITVAVLRNRETQETDVLARRLAAAALGDPYPALKPVVIDVAVLEQYEGVYRVDEEATRTLRVVDGRLTAQRTDRPREQLIAIADDTFVYSDGITRLQVERDSTGKVTGMRFWPEGEGEGIFAERTGRPLSVTLALVAAVATSIALLIAAYGRYTRGGRELGRRVRDAK